MTGSRWCRRRPRRCGSAACAGRRTVDLVDEGTVFRFPTDSRGRTVYRTVEGVSWLGDDRVVVVSDKVKPGSGERSGRAKDQSIHIFTIPTVAEGARP